MEWISNLPAIFDLVASLPKEYAYGQLRMKIASSFWKEWRSRGLAVVGTGLNWPWQVVCTVACRPPAVERYRPSLGGKFGGVDNIYRHHIDTAATGTQRIIIDSKDITGAGGTIVPGNMHIVLVGFVVGVHKGRVGTRVIILSLPDHVRGLTTTSGSRTTTCLEK